MCQLLLIYPFFKLVIALDIQIEFVFVRLVAEEQRLSRELFYGQAHTFQAFDLVAAFHSLFKFKICGVGFHLFG